MNADGSEKKVISEADGDINGFGFAGSGNRLFYLMDVKLDETTQDKYPDLPLAKGIVAMILCTGIGMHGTTISTAIFSLRIMTEKKLTPERTL